MVKGFLNRRDSTLSWICALFAEQFRNRASQCFYNFLFWCIGGKFWHRISDPGLRYKYFQDRRIDFQHFFTKGFDVKANSGFHIRHGFFVGVPLATTPLSIQGISNVTVRMFFYNYFILGHDLPPGMASVTARSFLRWTSIFISLSHLCPLPLRRR